LTVSWYCSVEVASVKAAVLDAAARATGTNAEPKSPASKPAVVIAVTSLFLRDH
jgi:hypothetical protein